MRHYLKENRILKLGENDFCIERVLGEGALSVAYIAVNIKNGVKHVVKEYNPSQIIVTRSQEGALEIDILSKKARDEYNAGLSRFIEGAQKQIIIRNDYPSSMNYTVAVNDIYMNVNNTAYIDMIVDDGETYDSCEKEKSIIEVLEHIKSIADAVFTYHEHGFLHLDIKPSNIFVLNRIAGAVKLFDFDSIIEKNKLLKGNVSISYSNGWAAPEQLNYRYHGLISEQTDIFSIGEILFFRLFERHSKITERWPRSKYDFSEIKGYPISDLRVQKKIETIFRKTINVSCNNRYKTCLELSNALEDVIKTLNKGEVFLCPSKLVKPTHFWGRENEILWINEKIQNEGIAILSGIGGIGKTEICREYVNRYKKNYDCIIIVHENYSWKDIVNKKLLFHLANYSIDSQREAMNEDELFDVVIKTIQSQSNERTLFVLDNLKEEAFSEKELDYREKVLGLPGKFLITTRAYSESYPCLMIGPLDSESLRELYCFYSNSIGQDDRDSTDELVELLGKHTLLVRLVAIQIKNSFSTCKEMIKRIRDRGLLNNNSKIKYNKYSGSQPVEYYQDLYECLYELSSIEKMSSQKWNIMYCLSLLPLEGIEASLFLKLIDVEKASDLQELVDTGWVTYEGKKLSLHPLIMHLCAEKGVGKAHGHVFCNSFYNYLEGASFREKKEIGNLFVFCIDKLIERKENNYSFLKILSLPPDYYLIYTHNYEKVEEYNVSLLNEIARDNDDYLELQITGMLNLSEIWCAHGDTEKTNVILRQVFEIINKNQSNTQSDLRHFAIRANLIYGSMFDDLDEVDKAKEYFDYAIDELKILPEREDLYADAYNYLGIFYAHSSEPEKAKEYYEMAIERYSRLYGNQSYQVSNTLYNIAAVTRDEGDLDSAIYLAERAIEDMVIILDSEYNELLRHPCVLLLSSYLLSGNPEGYIRVLKRYGHCLHSSETIPYEDLFPIDQYSKEHNNGYSIGYQAHLRFIEQDIQEITKLCYASNPWSNYCEAFLGGWYDASAEWG